MPLPTTYTAEEVADALKVKVETIRQMIKDGRIPAPARLSDARNAPYRFTDADVEALLKALRPVPVPTVRRRRRKAA